VTPRTSRTGPALLAVGYVVPVVLTVVLLARIGEYVLAVALAVIEIGISLATHRALHPRAGAAPIPQRAPGAPVLGRPGDPRPPRGARWPVLVGLALAGIAVAVVIGGTLAAQ